MAMKMVCSRLECGGENAWLGIDAIEWYYLGYYRRRLPVALRRSSALHCTAAPAWRLLESRAVRVTSPDETRLSGEFHKRAAESVVTAKSTKHFYVKEEKEREKENARPCYFLICYHFAYVFLMRYRCSSENCCVRKSIFRAGWKTAM